MRPAEDYEDDIGTLKNDKQVAAHTTHSLIEENENCEKNQPEVEEHGRVHAQLAVQPKEGAYIGAFLCINNPDDVAHNNRHHSHTEEGFTPEYRGVQDSACLELDTDRSYNVRRAESD